MKKREKRKKEANGKQVIAERGGTFLKINWNKRTVHYLSHSGQKKTGNIFGF